MTSDERRALIQRAAADLLSRHGYAGTTMTDIAQAAGLQKGSLYHFYTSKSELVYDLFKIALSVPQDKFDQITAADKGSTDKLVALIQALVDSNDSILPLMIAYTREDLGVILEMDRRRELASLQRRFENTWEDVIRQGIESGEFSSELDEKIVAFGIIGMINWMYKWYSPNGRVPAPVIARTFASIVTRGIIRRD